MYVILLVVRAFSSNIVVEEGVQMEKSMNQIEELFGAAKDEVRRVIGGK
jgi:hypothetical protein